MAKGFKFNRLFHKSDNCAKIHFKTTLKRMTEKRTHSFIIKEQLSAVK